MGQIFRRLEGMISHNAIRHHAVERGSRRIVKLRTLLRPCYTNGWQLSLQVFSCLWYHRVLTRQWISHYRRELRHGESERLVRCEIYRSWFEVEIM